MRLLVVEDEPDIQSLLTRSLTREGYGVEVVGTAAEAIRRASQNAYDAILLDIRIPDGSGFGVIESLRASGMTAPIMCVTGCAAIDDRVRGLDLGADDYLCKPFALSELLARVKAMLRRKRQSDEPSIVKVDDLELDVVRRIATLGGLEVSLTNREFDLLRFLAASAGRAVPRDEIMKEVWREHRSPELLTNVIEVCVTTLRKKLFGLTDEFGPRIQTVRRFGYVLRRKGEDVRGGAAEEAP